MPQPPKESFASLFEQSQGAGKRRRRFHTGDRIEVTVVAIAREAVFVDLGDKQEGLFERSDLTGDDGKLRVELGARISAVVSGFDPATGQARLTPIVVRADPASDEGEVAPALGKPTAGGPPLLVEGARVKGKVTGVERYGVFVQIAGTSGRAGRGLIPTAETGTPRGADLKKHFSTGQDVEAKILNVDESGKIRLSVAALRVDDERREAAAYTSAQGTGGAGAGGKPAPRGFGTLGDLLAKRAKR